MIEETQVFDRTALLNRVDGDEDFLEEIVGLFLTETAKRIDSLKEAARNQDPETLRNEAHSLKGSSANVAAGSLQEAAHQLETAAVTDDLTEADSLIKRIEDEFAKLRGLLGDLET